MNAYYQRTLDFQAKLKLYAWNIFKTYGRELVLRLEEYNLLQNKHNCIESSTAIGFVLEEFLVSKLEMFTHCNVSDETDYQIDRFVGATASESFDCYAIKEGTKYMVNVKAEKNGKANNAIAAIRQLHRNYCLEDPKQEKSFILLKVKYSIQEAYEDSEYKRAKPRCLHIDDLETYCLEEIDFSSGHSQDNRSWSVVEGETNKNSGRLLVSPAFRENHKMEINHISYQNTFVMLDNLIKKNK